MRMFVDELRFAETDTEKAVLRWLKQWVEAQAAVERSNKRLNLPALRAAGYPQR